MKNPKFYLAVLLVTAAPFLAARADRQGEWEALVKAAEKEGKVVIYGAPGTAFRNAFIQFTQAYPKIQVEYTGIGGAQAGPRIVNEQKVGMYTADLIIGGTTTPTQFLLPAKALDPLKSLLTLPEVTDPSRWFWNKLHWADKEQKYTLIFVGTVRPMFAYNTKLVNPDEIKSYLDLLDPKWKGKIVTWDPHKTGTGTDTLRFWYYTRDIGPAFIEQFFSKQNPAFSTDHRQMVDWLADGRYQIAIAVNNSFVAKAKGQGLPVAIAVKAPREGQHLSYGYGSISLLRRAPHPAAVKVYVNWLLSRAGQQAFQRYTGDNSLRIDIPKDDVEAAIVPKSNGKYYVFGAEQMNLDPILNLIDRALAKK